MEKKVLVLGANGFIGSHLVDRLASEGNSVRAFDRFGSTYQFSQSRNVEVFNGDFLNQNDLEVSLRGITTVIHLVSTTNPAVSNKEPLIDLSTNVAGSVSLFQKCVENGSVERIVFASSGGTVYGDEYPGRPFHETDPVHPVSPYGIGKLAIENYLEYFRRLYDQDYTVLRIANPYGGRQRTTRQQGIIPLLVDNVSREIPVTVFGDGSMVRDYIHIHDLVDFVAKSFQRTLQHQVYNVGSGAGISINKLIETVEDVVGKAAMIEQKEQPATFVQTSVLDNTRLLNEFPTAQLTSISDGIREVYESHKEQRA